MPAFFTSGAGSGLALTSPHRHLGLPLILAARTAREGRVLAGGRNALSGEYPNPGDVNMTFHPSDHELRHAARHGSPEPGSIEEQEALARIDDARLDDIEIYTGSRLRKQRRALRKHWRDRGAQLGQ